MEAILVSGAFGISFEGELVVGVFVGFCLMAGWDTINIAYSCDYFV